MLLHPFNPHCDGKCVIDKNRKKAKKDESVDSRQYGSAGTIEDLIIGHKQQDNGSQQAKRNFFPDGALCNSKRINDRGYPQDQKYIGDVTSQHIADGNVAVALETGNEVDKQFRGRGTKGNHRQPNNQVGYIQASGNRNSAVNQEVRSFDQKDEADGKKNIGQHGNA